MNVHWKHYEAMPHTIASYETTLCGRTYEITWDLALCKDAGPEDETWMLLLVAYKNQFGTTFCTPPEAMAHGTVERLMELAVQDAASFALEHLQ